MWHGQRSAAAWERGSVQLSPTPTLYRAMQTPRCAQPVLGRPRFSAQRPQGSWLGAASFDYVAPALCLYGVVPFYLPWVQSEGLAKIRFVQGHARIACGRNGYSFGGLALLRTAPEVCSEPRLAT